MSLSLPDVPFTRREFESAGSTRGWLRQHLREGSVRQVFSGVYVAAAVPDSIELRLQAFALVSGPEHIACDRTAAWLHGVEANAWGETLARLRPEVCVLPGRTPTLRPELRSRTRDLLRREVMQLGPLCVTTPVRTILDVGCILRRAHALAVMDQLRRLHAIDLESLDAELPRFRRRRGVLQLRTLLPLTDPRAESPRESWMRLAIHDEGLPAPESQWEVSLGGRTVRLDLAYPEHLVAVEYDGEEFHTRPEDVRRDAVRRQELARAGWRVIVVRRNGLHGAGRSAWLRELGDELARDPIMLRW